MFVFGSHIFFCLYASVYLSLYIFCISFASAFSLLVTSFSAYLLFYYTFFLLLHLSICLSLHVPLPLSSIVALTFLMSPSLERLTIALTPQHIFYIFIKHLTPLCFSYQVNKLRHKHRRSPSAPTSPPPRSRA